jgi:hypothetical protein
MVMMLKELVLKRINQGPSKVWMPIDFCDLGNRSVIDKTLQRLTHRHELRRIDRGFYDKPKINTLTGQVDAPDYHAIIDAVARRDQVRILLDGMTCANDLGLTNAVPGQVIVLIDGRLRPITIGNLTIYFKPTAPSKLYWAGRPGMRIIQSLYWLGDTFKKDADIQRDIVKKLSASFINAKKSKEIYADLKIGLHTLPIWMQSCIKELLFSIEKIWPKDNEY